MQHARFLRRGSSRARSRPEFHQLAIFLKVTETRSFAATAREFGCTQPAISQAIARLEDIYGGDLFERRRGAPLGLTPIGAAILPSARTLLHTVDEQMERAVESAQSEAGSLTLGFQSGLSAGPMRKGVAGFIDVHPDVRLRLVDGSTGSLHHDLIAGVLDLIVVGSMPDKSNVMLDRERLWDEAVYLALPATHRLARNTELTWDEVASITILLSKPDGDTDMFQDLSDGAGLQFEQHDVSGDVLLDLVGIGMGGAIILASAMAPHPDVVFRPVGGKPASVIIEAVWRRRDSNPLRHRLLRHIRYRLGGDPAVAAVSDPHPATAPAPDRG